MTRTLFLHVGPAKTGTSAVQHILQRHDNSTVIYPKVGLWADGSHHNLILNYFGEYKRPEIVREEPAALLARVGDEARRSERDIVISSEILAGRKDVTAFSAALEKEIGETLRIEFVAVVREHFERAASLYNQRVKDGVTGEKRDPDSFLASHAQGLCYAPLLKRLRKTGLDMSVLNYHPAGDCVQRVLARFGFSQEPLVNYPARNVSLGHAALVGCLAANRVSASPDTRNEFVSALRRVRGFDAPAGFIFGMDAAFAADRKFAKDRNFLLRRFGIEFPLPDFSVLAMPFGINPAEYEDICEIARRFGAFGRNVMDSLRTYIRE